MGGGGGVEVYKETSVQLESGVELGCGQCILSNLKAPLIDRFISRMLGLLEVRCECEKWRGGIISGLILTANTSSSSSRICSGLRPRLCLRLLTIMSR